MQTTERLYNIFAVHTKTGEETLLTAWPMKHELCINMKKRFTDLPCRRIELKEARSANQ